MLMITVLRSPHFAPVFLREPLEKKYVIHQNARDKPTSVVCQAKRTCVNSTQMVAGICPIS